MNESPCRGCEWINKDKKTFDECVNCEKRWGKKMHFQPHKVDYQDLRQHQCEWPDGCGNMTVTARYCTIHASLLSGRATIINRNIKKGRTYTQQQIFEYMYQPRRRRRDGRKWGANRHDGYSTQKQ